MNSIHPEGDQPTIEPASLGGDGGEETIPDVVLSFVIASLFEFLFDFEKMFAAIDIGELGGGVDDGNVDGFVV